MPERTTLMLTGATGFLGSRIADALRSRGVAWRALPGRLHETQPAHLDGIATVIHGAALGPGPDRRDEELFAVNAEGTRRLLDCCAQSGVRRFVHVSSMGVKSASAYGRSKLAAEDHVKRSPLEWLILRPAQVFGPNEQLRRTFEKLKTRMIWSLLGSGRYLMQIVYVRDCAAAVVDAALSGRAFETLNVIAPECSELEYFRTLRKVAGSRLLFVPTPVFRVRKRTLPADARAVAGLRTPGVADLEFAATPLELAMREAHAELMAGRNAQARR
jgi:nucleoside-diphosphate-sugar epimerase